ncbi:MFS general substrate transporter [Stipitochalara longipes BDJ]|nr:MFS general substrate transporter [Stipitochalara longipes BDJ]
MLIFNTWGIVVTFGDYQAFYESGKLFTQTSSNISWIGSLQALLVFTVGCIVGPIYDRGHLRFLLSVGTFCIVFGHMMLSLCTAYWQALLAQGVVVGIGSGSLFVPSFAVMQPYFSTRLGLAVGIAATGSAAGGIVYPVIFTNLIDKVGFGWTVRVIGFVALATLTIPLSVSKIRIKAPGVRKLVDWEAFTDGPYMLCIFGCLLGYTGCYTAFYYVSFYGEAKGWMSSSMALYLVPILNAGSVFGRVVPNWLADKIGPTNVLIPGAIMTGVLLLCNIAVHNSAGLIVTTFFFGLFSGMFVATPVLLLIALTKDKRKLGTRIGMAVAMMGLGMLSGGPGSGGVLQRHPQRLDWTGTWAYGGVFAVSAGLVFCVLRVWLGGWKVRVKV